MPSSKPFVPVVAAAALLVAAAVPAAGVTTGVHRDPKGDVSSIGYVKVRSAAKKRVARSIDLTVARVRVGGGDVVYRIHFTPALAKARSTGARVEAWLLFDKEQSQGELSATKQIDFVKGRVRTLGPRYITARWNASEHVAVFRVPATRLEGYRVEVQSGAVWKRAEYVDTMSLGRE